MEKNDAQERLNQMLEEMQKLTGRELVVFSADGEWIAGVPEDPHSALRRMLTGEIPPERARETCRRLHLSLDSHLLYVIRYRQDPDGILEETLHTLFADSPDEFVIEMDATRTALFLPTADLEGVSPKQYADEMLDTLQAEAMTNVWVGYGEPITEPEKISASYTNACTALTIGMVFYAEEKSYSYQQLGIARLIYKLPEDLCEMFLKEVLGESMEIDLDEEAMNTIRRLFENNLNISETARQLYIHRNTLVYRLERIEKKLGLDIRSFEDAMLFRIAMMVRLHLNDLHVVKS